MGSVHDEDRADAEFEALLRAGRPPVPPAKAAPVLSDNAFEALMQEFHSLTTPAAADAQHKRTPVEEIGSNGKSESMTAPVGAVMAACERAHEQLARERERLQREPALARTVDELTRTVINLEIALRKSQADAMLFVTIAGQPLALAVEDVQEWLAPDDLRLREIAVIDTRHWFMHAPPARSSEGAIVLLASGPSLRVDEVNRCARAAVHAPGALFQKSGKIRGVVSDSAGRAVPVPDLARLINE